nr:hypothetical protein [Allomuricauda sp.]
MRHLKHVLTLAFITGLFMTSCDSEDFSENQGIYEKSTEGDTEDIKKTPDGQGSEGDTEDIKKKP